MTGKKRKALSALIRAPTFAEAAREVGVSESTLRRWRSEPEFAREYRAQLDELVQEASLELRKGMREAAQTLREITSNQDAPFCARTSAAKAVIENGMKAVEADDILQRLEALEDAQID